MDTFVEIRFITESDWISSAIRFDTKSFFSHVEIVRPDGTYLGARHSGGVEIRDNTQYKGISLERHYRLLCSAYALGLMETWGTSKIGTPYNTCDILGILFDNPDLNSLNAFICSQFVIDYFAAGGIQLLNVRPEYAHRITPEHVHLSPLLIGKQYVPPLAA